VEVEDNFEVVEVSDDDDEEEDDDLNATVIEVGANVADTVKIAVVEETASMAIDKDQMVEGKNVYIKVKLAMT
jgi:hypothetical protein